MAMLSEIEVIAARTPGIVSDAIAAVQSTLDAMNFTAQGAQLMQTLADGMRSKVADVTAAAEEITRAVQGALPRKATMTLALATGMAAGGGLPAAALDMAPEPPAQSGASVGAQYLGSGTSGGATSVYAPITVNIQGNVDPGLMPDLKAAMEALKDDIIAHLEDEAAPPAAVDMTDAGAVWHIHHRRGPSDGTDQRQ